MALDPDCVTAAIQALVEKVRSIEKASRVLISDDDIDSLASVTGIGSETMRSGRWEDVSGLSELRDMLDTYLRQSPEVITSEEVARELSGITNELLIRATKAARLAAEQLLLKKEADSRFTVVDANGGRSVDYATQARSIVQAIEPSDFPGTVAAGVTPFKPQLDGMLSSTTRQVEVEIDAVIKEADDALRAVDDNLRTTSPEFEKHLYAATLGMEKFADGSPVHPVARKMADRLQKIEDRYIEMHKKAGVPLHVIENYTARSYWLDRMVANKQRAIELLRGVDFEAMGIKTDSMEDAAEILFENLTSVHGKTVSKILQRSYARSLASGHQFHRKIYFKTPADEFAFFLEFGEHSPMHYVLGPIHTMARSAVVAQTWGNGGILNAKSLFYSAVKDAINAQQLTRNEAKKLITAFHNRIDAVTGRWDSVSSPSVAAARESIASWVRAAMLNTTAIFSITTDPINIIRRSISAKSTSTLVAATVDMPETKFMGSIGQLLSVFSRDDQKWIADTALSFWRLGHMTAAGEALRRFQLSSSPIASRDVPKALRTARNISSRVQSSVLRLNLMQMGHRFTTRLNTMVNLTNIGAMLHLSWKQLNQRHAPFADRLARFGISEKHWESLRAAGTETLNGIKLPNARRLEEIDPLTYEVFRAFLDYDTSSALGIPGSGIRRMLSLGLNPNTPIGAVVSLTTMFSSWAASFVSRAIPEMVREARIGSNYGYQAVGKVAASSAALVGAGVVAAQLQQLASLKPLYSFDSMILYMKGLSNSGLAPIIGEVGTSFAQDISDGRAADPREFVDEALSISALGPAGGYLADGITAVHNGILVAFGDDFGRERYKREFKAARSASKLVPLPAAIITRGIIDRLIENWFFDKSPIDAVLYRRKMREEGRIPGTSPNF